jgi:hypothetical protein
MFDLVIAKYKEDISWSDNIKFKKIIYNKGDAPYPNAEQLENIGRESHTWVYHIVKNYNNLNEYTIFAQGDPFYHYKNFIETVNNLPYTLSTIHKYCDGLYGLADIFYDEDLEFLHQIRVFPEKVMKLISNKIVTKFHFAGGAQYIVHRDNITSKPIHFWEKLVEIHKQEEHWPWSIERVWPIIFGKGFLEDMYNKKSFI